MSVFANGMEVSGKATPNKTIAAMPDVCLSPPPPPAGPVPIPYPMTGMASDTSDGCTSVIVKGKEAGKKNSTKYSKTMGNEPATNSFGANVISHKISGPLKFAAYSFDVMFEGGGACRFADLTTQNHMNIGGGSVSVSVAGLNVAIMTDPDNPCPELKFLNKNQFAAADKAARNPKKSKAERAKFRELQTSGTVTHAFIQPAAGSPRIVGGTSNAVVRKAGGLAQPQQFKEKNLVPVTDADGKVTAKRISQQICTNAEPYLHARGGPHAHAEPCILSGLGPLKPTATVIMAIEWHSLTLKKDKKGKRITRVRDTTCGNCRKVLEHACQCMDIKLCNQDGTGTRDVCEQPEEDPV